MIRTTISNPLYATVGGSATLNFASNINIGYRSGIDFFNGNIDEVGLWNRSLT